MIKRSIGMLKAGLIGILAALLLVSCSLFGAEKNEQTKETETDAVKQLDFSIFADGKYQCKLIAPGLADPEVTEQRNLLRQALKSKTGLTPTFEKDDAVQTDDSTLEILLGQTDRKESQTPDGVRLGTDAYWVVALAGNKLVINGSDAYQLSLAVKYFTETYLAGDAVETLTISENPDQLVISKDFSRDYWQIKNIPAYPAGENYLVPGSYNGGTTILELSSGGRNDSSTEIHVIQRSNAEEFAAYRALLERYDYVEEYENVLENNTYVGYYNGEHRVYISLNSVTGNVKVCLDPTGMSVSEFGYTYTPKEGETSVFYQYAIPMADGTGNGHPNCGMLEIIKCADNSVIVIDGGVGEQQMNDIAVAGLNDFLHEITGVAEGEKIQVAAWYFTHYHSDHTAGFLRFLQIYKNQYVLERVLGNAPTSDAVANYQANLEYRFLNEWQILLKGTYPECKELKVHTGQKIRIADLTLQVLYTHEDLLNNKSEFNSGDSNDTSTVIRIDNGKMSMMVLGDANSRTQSVITTTFGEKTLKSDIMQATHHLIYYLEILNYRIAPSIVYIPQSEEVSGCDIVESGSTYKYKLDRMIALVGEENCYFGGSETVGMAFENGKITKVYYKDGVIGKNPAGSGLV